MYVGKVANECKRLPWEPQQHCGLIYALLGKLGGQQIVNDMVMDVFLHPIFGYLRYLGLYQVLLKNVRPLTFYRNNFQLLHYNINKSVDSGTLKKEMWRHQVIFVAHDPKLISEAENVLNHFANFA